MLQEKEVLKVLEDLDGTASERVDLLGLAHRGREPLKLVLVTGSPEAADELAVVARDVLPADQSHVIAAEVCATCPSSTLLPSLLSSSFSSISSSSCLAYESQCTPLASRPADIHFTL